MTNYYTQEFGPLLLNHSLDNAPILDALAEALSLERPKWHALKLRLLHADSKLYRNLKKSLLGYGFSIEVFFQYDNWFYTVNNITPTDYFNSRPSRLKNTIKRKSKKLKNSVSSEIVIVEQFGVTLNQAILDYMVVYEKSWKQNEPYTEFMRKFILLCAEYNILRLGILYIEKKPVASQFWISLPNKSIIYKLAYDEEFKQFSVGSLLSKNLFDQAIESRVPEIDYGVGSETYKRDWMNHSRQLYGIEAYNKYTIIGSCLTLFSSIRNRLKRMYRFLSNTK